MRPIEFQCPECAARLRLKDRAHLQRIIPCPDCGERLHLQTHDDQVVAARLDSDVAPVNRIANPALKPRNTTANSNNLLTPRNVSFLVASLVLLTFGSLMFWPTDSSTATAETKSDEFQPAQQKPALDPGVGPSEISSDPNEPQQASATDPALAIDPPAPADEVQDVATNDSVDQSPDESAQMGIEHIVADATDLLDEPPPAPTEVIEPAAKENKVDQNEGGNNTKKEKPVAPEPLVDTKEQLAARRQRMLQQRVLAYEQPKPVKLSRLLLGWQELSGIDVEFGPDVEAESRDKPIALKLQNTTVQKILDELLQQANLKAESESDRILIVNP